MLTETYTLVALSVEQTSVRMGVQSFQRYVQSRLQGASELGAAQVEHAGSSLRRLFDQCRWRKLDRFVIPAIRRATRAMDGLLAELDALTQRAAAAMAEALEALQAAPPQAAAFCAAADRFCAALLQRLEREERELLPAASARVPGEIWFAVAHQLLAHEAVSRESRPLAAPRNPPGWRAAALHPPVANAALALSH